MADLFGAGGRRLVAELDFPEAWLSHVRASVELIDDLDRWIGEMERWLQRSLYKERYQRTKRRLGRQRGAKVAQIELARKLTEAIWYMLTRNSDRDMGTARHHPQPSRGP